jgi:CelD/BcsL family acetyltransferase involved in cellulose biosynthesis
MSSLEVETADAARFLSVEHEWRDLVRRAWTPNVFMEPAVVAAAEVERPTRTLLVWARDADGGERKLVGVWAFAMVRATWLPFRILRSPLNQHLFLGTPVLDRFHLRDALVVMVDELMSRADVPGIVEARDVETGPILDLFVAIVSARKLPWRILKRMRRAKLERGLDAAAYLTNTISSARRRRLASCRRKLEALGQLEWRLVQRPELVAATFEHFLTLEGSGWKANWTRGGRALQCHPKWAEMARRVVVGLARDELVTIRSLTLNGRTIAMDVLLRSGNEAYTWKMAYDEMFRAHGPGLLLLEECTRGLLNDPLLTTADSCSYREIGIMTEFWAERRELADVVVAFRGRSFVLACVVAIRRLRHGIRKLLTSTRNRLRSAMMNLWRRLRL